MKKTFSTIALLALSVLAFAAPKGMSLKMVPQAIRIDTYEAFVSANLLIVKPEAMPESLDAKLFTVQTAGKERTISGIYRCDEKGTWIADGCCLAFALALDPSCSPLKYDFTSGRNKWVEAYPVKLSLKEGKSLKIKGTQYTQIECSADDMMPNFISESDVMSPRAYTYNSISRAGETTITAAAYEPWDLRHDGVKNPLVIWMHGGGEGGTDVRIALMGNETIALIRPEIQSHFSSEGGAKGAYVLALQSPTRWMDTGEGTTYGDVPSMYSDAVKAAIDEYVRQNGDIDPTRIYIGGCSNGGYMTVNMVLRHPKFFAAAYPVCEAYHNRFISDEQIAMLAKENIWFVQSYDDTTVDPKQFCIPTYERLVKAGAANCWMSMFENIQGKDIPGAKYLGHFSWVYVFNDQVTAAQEQVSDSIVPTNNGGGTVAPQGFRNLFDWMNAQKNR